MVYVRQSTLKQVTDHQESTRIQYGLVGRAEALGDSPDRIITIDKDLGKSGSSRVHQGQKCNIDSLKHLGHWKNVTGQNFWARDYNVSAVGRDEAMVRQYIRDHEKEDQRLGQLTLWQRE